MKNHIVIVTTLLFLLLFGLLVKTNAQTNKWTNDEEQYYGKMKSLCAYIQTQKKYDTTQREFIFKEFVFFDNILNDTSNTRLGKRLQIFDALFSRMIHFIDSIGLSNLDAMPARFFKNDSSFLELFGADEDIQASIPYVLAYFDKRHPKTPLGFLLFEPKTHKLLSWILLNQGGYYYFLTFNLL